MDTIMEYFMGNYWITDIKCPHGADIFSQCTYTLRRCEGPTMFCNMTMLALVCHPKPGHCITFINIYAITITN